jgi:hypothetical protein
LALAKRSFATTLVCCTSRDNLQRIHTLTFLHYDLVVYFHHMDETKIEERFNQLEKRVSDGFVRMEDGFTRMETLIETLANSSAREFASLADRFAAVDKRFEAVDERLNPAAGNEIFGCRDGKPKIGSKDRQRPQRRKSKNEPAIIPAKTASFESPRKSVVWKDWVVEAIGHKLATHHPVIEPVSAAEPGTEICDAETGPQKSAYPLAETNPETRRECEKPPFRRNKCEKADGSLNPTTGWWRWYGSNWLPPTQSYRTASLPPP